MSENLAGDRVKYEEYHFRYSALSQYAIISHMQNFYLQHSYMPQTSWNEFIYDYDHLLSKPYWHVITHNLYTIKTMSHIYLHCWMILPHVLWQDWFHMNDHVFVWSYLRLPVKPFSFVTTLRSSSIVEAAQDYSSLSRHSFKISSQIKLTVRNFNLQRYKVIINFVRLHKKK